MNYGKSSKKLGSLRSKAFPRPSLSEITNKSLTAATAFLLGLCPLPFSVFPFGIAFACAASPSAAFAFAGLAAATLFSPLNSAVYMLSVIFTLVLRMLWGMFIDGGREQIFRESLPLRVACAAVSVFVLSLYPVITGGFRYFDLFGAILSIAAATVGVLVFDGAFDVSHSKRFADLRQKAAKLAISALLCLALASLDTKSFTPALTLAFLLTLNFCLTDGLLLSALCAVLCGAACGIENIPVLVIAAFTAFCVLDVSPALAAAVACISGSICGVMISGSGYMTLPFISLLLGCAVFTALKKISAARGGQAEHIAEDGILSQIRLSNTETLLAKTQCSLRSLSSLLPSLIYADRLMEIMKAEIAAESESDTRLSRTISRRLYELGFGKTSVTVTGKRNLCVRLRGERLAGKPERAELIRRQTEAIVGFPLTRAKPSEGGTVLTFFKDSVISYHHSLSQAAKEEICGDSAEVFFDSERNYLYAVICDGMGSGKEANSVSTRAVSVIKSLVLAGLEPMEALVSLSDLLCHSMESNGEISTTVDLMRLDLYTGDGVVIKSGAAPSYLKSQNGLKKLCARTVPMGIFNIADTEEIKFNVKEGDVIIMASDGVAEDDSDSRPIEKYLDSHRSALPREMASDIIEMSRKSGKTDDLSVIAIKIFPQNY